MPSWSKKSEMKTRRYLDCDRKAVSGIYLKSRTHAFAWMDSSLFRIDDFDRDTKGEKVWVLTQATHLLGFISVWEAENFIYHLFVDPRFFGQSVGTTLLRECLKHIGRPASLKCSDPNTIARDFYLSKGWRILSKGSGPDGKYLLMHYENE